MAKKSRKTNQFDLSEAFRQLRTNIEFSNLDTGMKVINVVSTNPNEGKSTVASNLAKIYCDKYSKVLIIDCDLRNPSIHKMYGISNVSGLSNLLTNYDGTKPILNYGEVKLLRFEDIDKNLYVLTAGKKVLNPNELLSTKRFSNFIQQAKKEFDIVIIDCPPCVAVSDAIPVCNIADGTLYVVSADETDKFVARNAMSDLTRNGANIIGLALTKIDTFHDKYEYYYGSGE